MNSLERFIDKDVMIFEIDLSGDGYVFGAGDLHGFPESLDVHIDRRVDVVPVGDFLLAPGEGQDQDAAQSQVF